MAQIMRYFLGEGGIQRLIQFLKARLNQYALFLERIIYLFKTLSSQAQKRRNRILGLMN